MYVIIIGGGKVGLNLAKSLIGQKHEVAVIETNPNHCNKVVDETSALVINGDGTEIRYLEDANCANADVLVAVTGVDEDNLVACQLARTVFNVPKIIARVNNPYNKPVFEAVKVDVIFDSTIILATLIHEGLGIQDLINLAPVAKGKLRLIETTICNSGVVGKHLIDLGLLNKGIIVVSVVRGDEVFIPHGATALQLGDQITVVVAPEVEEELMEILTTCNGNHKNGHK